MKLLLFAAAVSIVFAAPAFGQKTVTVDETARFLAGMPVGGVLEPLTKDSAWTRHASEVDRVWAKKEAGQLAPIRAWMDAHAAQYYRSAATMYYMFSGPDILYAHTFFPNAQTYILCGIEPVGSVPDLAKIPPDAVLGALGPMRHSLSTILQFHYFITKDMRADLVRTQMNGTVPLLYVLLARMGCTILDTEYVKSPAQGVKITFKHGGSRQTVYYFKTDISNGGGSSAFFKWSAAQGPGNSLLKAASYLLHTEDFSKVRGFLLENSRCIVQDDSGIPLRAFPKGWTVRWYGRYIPHGEMFGKYYQSDLAKLFADQPPADLGFAFGYHWQRARGILMLGTKE